jgi:4-carboxymuconolactone decarboxylase
MTSRHSIVLPATAAAMLALCLASVAQAQDRLPMIPKDKLTPDQQKLTAERGNLAGPWVPLLRSPEVLRLMMDMRAHVASRSLLNPQLTEIPILVSAREWTQQFEWNAHAAIAAKTGLKAEIITAIAEGRRPRGMSEDEDSLYDLCMELQRTKGVSDATYNRALKALGGEEKIVEAVALQGYYALLAMVMNTARTPLPEGRTPPLPLFPR